MPKRCNPYADDFIQQSKIHVGLKQFNNNEDKLKKVYEKTLQLLFHGSKKIRSEDVMQNPDLKPIEKKDGMKQLFIGKDGSLLYSGTLTIDKNLTIQHCACSGLKSDCCAYCEIVLCSFCQHQCKVCKLSYCSKCSLNGSEGTEICVSCYS
ncbi:unnamed protein product, partial [Brenthis ino]